LSNAYGEYDVLKQKEIFAWSLFRIDGNWPIPFDYQLRMISTKF